MLLVAVIVVVACGAVPAVAGAHDRAAIERAILHPRQQGAHQQGSAHRPPAAGSRLGGAGAHSRRCCPPTTSRTTRRAARATRSVCAPPATHAQGYRSWSVGEVIGWGTRHAGTAKAIFKAWMNSSGHRAIILNRRWRDVGIGCAQGTFKGIPSTLMYTVDFGRRIR